MKSPYVDLFPYALCTFYFRTLRGFCLFHVHVVLQTLARSFFRSSVVPILSDFKTRVFRRNQISISKLICRLSTGRRVVRHGEIFKFCVWFIAVFFPIKPLFTTSRFLNWKCHYISACLSYLNRVLGIQYDWIYTNAKRQSTYNATSFERNELRYVLWMAFHLIIALRIRYIVYGEFN